MNTVSDRKDKENALIAEKKRKEEEEKRKEAEGKQKEEEYIRTHFRISDGCLIQYIYLGEESSVTITNGVTTIGDRAFSNCENLTSITIPDSVTTIGKDLFFFCGKLTKIIAPYHLYHQLRSMCPSYVTVTI